MSNVIDQRVVEMRFDNRQFESGVSTSMSTLDKLKRALKLDGVTKGLENISSSAKKVDMSGLSNGIETVRTKFSALEIMGITTLANITNSAVNAGKSIASALTIDPIRSGFQEYETQMNAIQTILANTSHAGTTLKDVTAALDELNTYADQTIYNFTEMTKNIGTFTAAGVDLDTSVGAIKGIANLAAMSGSTSAQASTAMYQLSQAIAAGRVSLEDWNSVVNAGMGGKIFQDALMNTAEAMGIVVDRSVSFRESVSTLGGKQSWLTSDVLLNTLNQFTGDLTKAELATMGFTEAQITNIQQMAVTANDAATKVKTLTQLWDTMQEAVGSGWAKTWQLIVGDFEEAKSFFTDLSNMFGEIIQNVSDSRNNLLEGALGSKWDNLVKKINEAGVATEDFDTELQKTVKSHGLSVDELIKKHGSLAKAFSSGAISSNMIIETLKRMAGISTQSSKATAEAADKLEYFNDVVRKVVRGDFGNGAARIDALTKAGYDNVAVQKLVNKVWERNGYNWSNVTLTAEELTEVIGDLSVGELQSIGYTKEQATALKELAEQAEKTGTPINELIANLERPSGRELLLDSITNVLHSIINSAKAVGRAWKEIFPPMTSDQLYNMIAGIHQLSEGLAEMLSINEETGEMSETLDKLTRTLKGVFAIVDLVTSVIGGGFKLAFDVISEVLSTFDMDLLDLTAALGDAAVGLRNFIKDNGIIGSTFKALADGISSGIIVIRDWTKEFVNLPSIQAVIERIKDSFSDLKSVGEDALAGLQNGLRDGITSIPQILIEIGKKLLQSIKDVLGIHSPSTEMYEVGKYTIEGLVNGISDGAGTLLNVVKNIFSTIVQTIGDIFGDATLSDVVAAGISISIIAIANKIANALNAFAAPFEGIGDVLSGVGEILEKAAKPIAKVIKSVSNVLNSYAMTLKADALKSIATAIAILAGSVFLLAQLDSAKLWESIGALAALAGVLALLSAAAGKFGPEKAGSFAGLAAGIVGLSASLLIIAVAIKKLDSLDPTKLNATILTFTTIVASMGVLMTVAGAVVNGRSAKNITKLGTMMLGLSASLLLMVGAIKIISGMSAEDFLKGGAAITAFVGIVAALGMITNLAGGSIDKFGSTMLKMSVALGLFVGVVALISTLSYDSIAKGVATLTAFTGIIAILTLITNLGGPLNAKLGTTLLAMSSSMLILTSVVMLISTLSVEDIMKGVAALTAFTGIIALLVGIVKMAGTDAPKISATLLAMSVSIGILASIAVVMSLIDLEGLAKGITAVGILSTFMALMVAATRGANDVKGNIVAMSVAIGVMAAAVAALSFIDPGPLAGATAALSVVMGMFALILHSGSDIKTSMGVLIAMTAAIGVLGGVIYALSGLPIESVLGTAAALSILMASISAAMLIISKAKGITAQTAITLAALTGAVAGIAAILAVLEVLDIQPSIETAAALSILLTALSGACLILAGVGKIGAGAALQGALALDGVILVVGGLMAGIGALVAYFPQLEEFVTKGVDIFTAVGQGIGGLVGGIVGGVMSGVTSSLPKVADNLSDFMTNLQPFLEGTKMVDSSSVNSVASLAKMILTLTGASVLNGIASFFGGGSNSLEKFGEQIVPFGKAMANFSDTISGKVDSAAMESVTNAGMMLAELNKSLPKQGGLLQGLIGSKDLGLFGTQLSAFGEAIVGFSETIAPGGTSKVNVEATEAAANAGKLIAELNGALPRQGGLLQDFLGSQDLGVFAEQMKSFGLAIVAFSEAVAPGGTIKVNVEATEAAANAGKVIAELNNELPRQGGLLQDFLGSQDLSVFATQLKSFGRAIVAFSETVAPDGTSRINLEAVTAATNAGRLISELNSELPKQGGALQSFLGTQDLSIFGEQMKSFGRAITEFSQTIAPGGASLINTDAVKAAGNSGKMLAELANNLPSTGGFLEVFTGKKSMAEFGTDLVAFGEGLASYADSISDITPESVTASSNAAKTLLDLSNSLPDNKFFGKDASLSDFGKEISVFGEYFAKYYSTIDTIDSGRLESAINAVKSLIEMSKSMSGIDSKAMSGFGKALTSLGKSGVDDFINAFKDADSRVRTAVSGMLNSMIDAANSQKNTVVNSFTAIVTEASDTIKSKNDEFKKIGNEIMTKLLEGLNSRKETIRSSVSSIVTTIASTIRAQYSSIRDAGVYLVGGLTSGINDGRSSVNRAAKSLASSVVSTMKRELEIHSPSRVMRDEVGKYIVEGIAEGITEDMSAEEAAEKKAENITSAFQDAFEQLDIADETQELQETLNNEAEDYSARYERQVQRIELALAKYKNLLDVLGETAIETQKAYNEYLQEEIDLREMEERKTREAYESAISLIEQKRQTSQMSLIEELAAYKRLQSAYAEGTQERLDLDSKIESVEDEIADATEDYYNRLTELQENAAAQREQIDSDFESNRTQILQNASQQRLQLEQEYADKTKQINEQLIADIEAAEKAYEDAVKSREDTIYNAFGMFDAANEDQEIVAGETLIANLKNQLESLGDWTDDLNFLAGKGLDEEFIDELREMGIDSAAEIKALTQMTDSQLNEYVSLWRQKHELAHTQAVDELEDLRQETNDKIVQLRVESMRELDEYRASWQQQMWQLNRDTNSQLMELQNSWYDRISELDAQTNEQMEDLKEEWLEKVGELKEESESEFSEMTKEIINEIGNETQWSEAGASMIEGVLMGVVQNTPRLVDGVRSAMMQALQVAKAELGINSPSKEFAKLGRYSTEGFAIGLSRYVNPVIQSTKDLGSRTLDALRNTVSKISDVINSDVDMQPTVRPVLDLSDLKDGVAQLDTMFNRRQALTLSSSIGQRAIVEADQNGSNSSEKSNTYQFVQNNYSPKSLSRVEIYRQTKNQFSTFERMIKA